MSKKIRDNFRVDISPYDGDPTTLQFFKEQIKELASINSWTKPQTLSFIKSKLTGSALKFYVEAHHLKTITDVDTLFKELEQFFCSSSKATAIHSLNLVSLLPRETVRNLAHRINVLVQKVHAEVTDQNALNSIKYTKLLTALPQDIRMKIMETNIKDFDRAVNRAQQLQDLSIENLVLNQVCTTEEPSSFQAELHALRETVEELKNQRKTDETQKTDSSPVRRRMPETQPRRNYDRRWMPEMQFRQFYCYFCGRNGHKIKDCREHKRFIQNRDDRQPNNRGSYIYRHSSYRGRGPHPN